MPRIPARNAYTSTLLAARSTAHSLGRDAVARIREQFETAAERLSRTTSASALVQGRTSSLRKNMLSTLAALDAAVGKITEGTVTLTVREISRIHADATVKLYAAAGVNAPTAALMSRFSSVPVRALAALNAKRRGAATFRTLYHRHMMHAAEDMDRLIGAAIARGASASSFAKDVASLLLGEDIETAAYGLGRSDVTGLRTLWYDARRIAVSETNNALREANNMALEQTGIIAAAKWQLSGRHEGLPSSPDECDELAGANHHGFGAGYYPPAQWPVAPHPFCGCTQGGPVIYKDPSQWPTETSAPPDERPAPSTEPASPFGTKSAKVEDWQQLALLNAPNLEQIIDEGRGDWSRDAVLARILKEQGFDGKPRLASVDRVSELRDAGAVELWRGLRTSRAAEYAEQFQKGELFPGVGVYGNGTYAASGADAVGEASAYMGNQGVMLRMVLDPEARVIDFADIEARLEQVRGEYTRQEFQLLQLEAADRPAGAGEALASKYGAVMDYGRLAAALGYDAIRTPAGGGWYYVILNRSALVVQDHVYSASTVLHPNFVRP